VFGILKKEPTQVQVTTNLGIADAVWRDLFAGMVLQSAFTEQMLADNSSAPDVARACYNIADAMIAERRKREGGDD
jgi:hypothetical protein